VIKASQYLVPAFSFLLCLLAIDRVVADHVEGHAKLEWGIGLAALTTPDYRGSTEHQSLLLPFPYLKYRGDRLRIDDGIEGRIFNTPDLLLSISGNGSLPSTEDNAARAGMAELDASIEFGPSLEYRLMHDTRTSLWLELPLRFAYTIQDNPEAIGQVFHPRIAWRKPAQHKQDWKLRFAAGPLFADKTYHGYYYNVADIESNADRQAYTADTGYSGFRADFTYSKRIDNLWLGGFVRFDDLTNSEIENSPLVTDDNNWTAGFGLAWVLSEK
jgi:outer membrane scaffolding protein for murein synthesis (MipA/OmpV family)